MNHHRFILPYSKKLIASRLGIEVETFSSTLLKLQEYGIKVIGSHVVISDINTVGKNVYNHCSIEQDCKLHANFKKEFKIILLLVLGQVLGIKMKNVVISLRGLIGIFE